jgi:hypothetical protein
MAQELVLASSRIAFNQGVASAEAKNWGEAMAYFSCAKRINSKSPELPDAWIEQNIHYVSGQSPGVITPDPASLFALWNENSVRVPLEWLGLFVAIIVFFSTLKGFFEGKRIGMGRTLFLLALSLLLTASTTVSLIGEKEAPCWALKSVPVFSGPGTQYIKAAQTREGQLLRMTGHSRDGWYEVQWSPSQSGWVSSDALLRFVTP